MQQTGKTADDGWRGWDYERWNERLVAYCFRSDDSSHGQPVERIPATPEELVEVVGDPAADLEAVAEAFVASVLARIPPGTSFERFCGDYGGWSPASDEPPHFFAALWLTCLVAYGYPLDESDGFHIRMAKLFGRTQHLESLPDFWSDLAEWTENVGSADGYAGHGKLVLPPYDNYRKTIGSSWFLAFPHRRDRRVLRGLLVRKNLVGEEPPIAPVVAALQENEGAFGPFFRKDLEKFVEDFVEMGADARRSAFWRAVRQEALAPAEGDSEVSEASGEVGLMAVLEDGELFVFVACSDGIRPPEGFCVRKLGFEIEGFSQFLAAEEAVGDEGMGMAEATEAVLEERLRVPNANLHAGRGVLVFQGIGTNEYRLAGGSEANQAEAALVRDDKADAFTRVYGGAARTSRFGGWHQVFGCKVLIRSAAPPGLESVTHLQETMAPPVVRLVGGLRTGAGFYALPGFLPRVRFDSAERVDILDGADLLAGEARPSPSEDNEWYLPEWLVRRAPGRWKVRVSWPGTEGRVRISETALVLVDRQISHNYKLLGAGRYFAESCAPGKGEVEGGSGIPVGVAADEITDENARMAPDLIELEPDLRYLGPGVGEFSPAPRSGFDWMVVGPRNRPDLLMFVGDTESPTSRANRRSADAGARRHWQGAIHDSRRQVARLSDGRVVPITEAPRVEQALRDYRDRREQATEIESTPDTTNGTGTRRRWPGVEPDGRVGHLADALAALSMRKSGVEYSRLMDHLSTMLGIGFRDAPSLFFDLIRGWIEAGTMDVARPQGRRATYVLARRPSFVAFGVGDRVRASLLGLVPSVLEAQTRRAARERGADFHALLPPCRWLPRVVRVECESPSVLRDISSDLGLTPPRWLRWPVPTIGDETLDMSPGYQQDELREGAAPESFAVEGRWNWFSGRFIPVPASSPRLPGGGINVEKRTHRERSSVYVVLVEGEEWAWTYARNWALLLAYSLDEESPPFLLRSRYPIVRPGGEGVYLPLPIGRLCAVLGDGLAGPVLGSGGAKVEEYRYPLAFGYRQALARWISEAGCIDFDDREEA